MLRKQVNSLGEPISRVPNFERFNFEKSFLSLQVSLTGIFGVDFEDIRLF